MAATTITEFTSIPCSRCGGRGIIASFQYHQGGTCFRCGGEGVDPVMKMTERDMTDDEVIAALDARGFTIMLEVPEFDENDFMTLFVADEQQAKNKVALEQARLMLAAL